MNEKIDTLIEESASGDAINGDIVSLESFARRSELLDGVVGVQPDGSDDGDVWLELRPTELRSEGPHQLGEPGAHVFRWDRPHRVHIRRHPKRLVLQQFQSVSLFVCVALSILHTNHKWDSLCN